MLLPLPQGCLVSMDAPNTLLSVRWRRHSFLLGQIKYFEPLLLWCFLIFHQRIDRLLSGIEYLMKLSETRRKSDWQNSRFAKKAKSWQHPRVFPNGPPVQYWPGPATVNFGVRKRSGVFGAVWPLATIRHAAWPIASDELQIEKKRGLKGSCLESKIRERKKAPHA